MATIGQYDNHKRDNVNEDTIWRCSDGGDKIWYCAKCKWTYCLYLQTIKRLLVVKFKIYGI